MEDGGNFKKINVGEHFLQFKSNKKQNRGPRKSARREEVSQLKPSSVKELLLEKLKQYKKEKTRKNRDVQQTSSQNAQNVSSYESASTPSLTTGFLEHAKRSRRQRIVPPKMNHNYGRKEPDLVEQVQPEYGNLKNGVKPTYRQLHRNRTMKRDNPISRLKVEVEKKFNVGRNITQKKVGVFIKSNELRRKINDEKVDIQRSNIRTVKNYLKTQNLIKYGSHAPNDLLREIYSSSKLCGDVFNVNGQSLVHNYMNDT